MSWGSDQVVKSFSSGETRTLRLILVSMIALGACERELQPPPGATLGPPAETPPPEEVYAPDEVAAAAARPRYRVVPAFIPDMDYGRRTEVEAHRVIYRVSLRVPANLGSGHASLPPQNAELYVDVSNDRLRARFVGHGWPVPDGSEVRIRRDQPGAYVFDGAGGRPLGPGQLAQWFEGGRPRREASLRVAVPPNEEQVGPGPLLCRLIAEWSMVPPDSLERRCGEGGTPPSFRVGLWRAYRTADVGVVLPGSALRADHEHPPVRADGAHGGVWLSEAQFARLRQIRGAHGVPTEDAPERGLIIVNTSPARMIVTIGGTPVGWVDSHQSFHFEHIERGSYPVGAMRPLGLQMAQKRPRVVPGRVQLPR